MIGPTMKFRLHTRVLRRAMTLCFACAVLLAGAAPVFGQEDAPKHDARLDGYAGNVAIPNASTALIWLLFIFLGVVALATLFKDAKRTHLD
jgi:hypothetical protein